MKDILNTERLILREASEMDAAFFHELLNSPNWKSNISDKGLPDLPAAVQYIKRALMHSYTANGFGLWVMELKETRQAIGICGLVKRDSLEHPDLGFAVLPEYEGLGYTSEAAIGCLDHGRTELGLETILAITTESNVGSKRVLEKLGMKRIPNSKSTEQDLVTYSC